jgi:glycosyltransferase involved in cell wall biosynthesis
VRFSILIPSWNNLACLKACVEGIRSSSTVQHEILVHANEATDGTLEWLERQGIRYRHTSSNVGICVAMNELAKLASADWLCYMNDDMYPCNGWDDAMTRAISEIGHTRCYLSGTMVEWRHTRNRCAIAPLNFGETPADFDKNGLEAALARVPRRDWSGATWPPSFLHRSLWDEVGGFDIGFSPGLYSDPDLSMKLWAQGVRVFRGVGDCRVYHFMSKTTGRIQMNDGKSQFRRKWGVSASWFMNRVLRTGRPYSGALPERQLKPGPIEALRELMRGVRG